jgi:hypothetical protein
VLFASSILHVIPTQSYNSRVLLRVLLWVPFGEMWVLYVDGQRNQ